jgi:hypothetical protein
MPAAGKTAFILVALLVPMGEINLDGHRTRSFESAGKRSTVAAADEQVATLSADRLARRQHQIVVGRSTSHLFAAEIISREERSVLTDG